MTECAVADGSWSGVRYRWGEDMAEMWVIGGTTGGMFRLRARVRAEVG